MHDSRGEFAVRDEATEDHRADHLSGHRKRSIADRITLRAGAEFLVHQSRQSLRDIGERRSHLLALAPAVAPQGSDDTTGVRVAKVPLRQVSIHRGSQIRTGKKHPLGGLACGRSHGFGDKLVASVEMAVEAAVSQPGFFHEIRHTGAVESFDPESFRRRADDALADLRFMLFGESHDDYHAMRIDGRKDPRSERTLEPKSLDEISGKKNL